MSGCVGEFAESCLGEVDDIVDCGLKLLPLEMQQLPLMSYNIYYKHSKYAVVMLYPDRMIIGCGFPRA